MFLKGNEKANINEKKTAIAGGTPDISSILLAITYKDILDFLVAGGVLVTAVMAPNAVQIFKFLLKDKNYISFKKFSQSRVRQQVRRMEDRGLIKRKRKGQKIEFILTSNGIKIAKRCVIDNFQLAKQKRWDGKWRVVIFDIPERKKMARDALRERFRHFGMRQLQKSVFVYPYDCQKEINLVSDFFNVGEDILYMEADIMDIKKDLRKIFNV